MIFDIKKPNKKQFKISNSHVLYHIIMACLNFI